MVNLMNGYHILIRNTLAQNDANAVFSFLYQLVHWSKVVFIIIPDCMSNFCKKCVASHGKNKICTFAQNEANAVFSFFLGIIITSYMS